MSTQTDKTEKKSYKDTLNLPQTAFPMEAKLVQNEPARLQRWQDARKDPPACRPERGRLP